MNTTHHTLEIYNCLRGSLSSQEHFESAYHVTLRPEIEVLYHGTKGIKVYSRALRTITGPALPKVLDDVQLVCWRTLDSTITNHDLKKESAIEVLERALSDDEKAPLIQKLHAVLKDDASDAAIDESIRMWKKWGIYKENMGQLSILLLHRNRILTLVRSKTAFVWDSTFFPQESFCTTLRIWVAPALVALAKKIAGLICDIDSHRSVCICVPEHSSEKPPTLQISRTYQTFDDYVKASKNDIEDLSLDTSLDLLLRVIATTYERNYWLKAN